MEGSFEFEILYTGKQDQNFNLVYREYVDGLQRADFSQDLSYSTTESDTIQFKSLTIDIKEVTNSAIKFKVLEDGGLPWLPR
jgi:hypothetical protein